MKNNHRVNIAVRVLALLMLGCMLVPTFASCRAKVDETPIVYASELEGAADAKYLDADVPEGLALKTAHGFVKNGGALSMNVVKDEPVLDLARRFSVADGAEYTLSTDEAGESRISGEALTLSEGENVFYVTVSDQNDSFTYKATVTYTNAYTVEFYSNCDDYIETQKVSRGDLAVVPEEPTRKGYTFSGWYLDGEEFDFSQAITEDCTLIAHWKKLDESMASYYTSSTKGTDAVKFTNVSAGLRVVWKDYANANGMRPDSVTCVLTQKYGSTTKEYEIILTKDSAEWANARKVPCVCSGIGQGEGDWTLAIESLPGKVGALTCEYTLTQKALSGEYTTKQAGGSVYNSVIGYNPTMPEAFESAKLTTRNARLYDAAGNLIVFNGVVSGNIDWDRSFNDLGVAIPTSDKNDTNGAAAAFLQANEGKPNYNVEVSPAMQQLVDSGCNAIRATVPIVGSLQTYVYWAVNGNYRTGWYKDEANAASIKAASEDNKNVVLARTCAMIDAATAAGLYIIIDWPILTSNPYDYLEEAKEFFGFLSERYADNPYVLYEICNEPGSCGWSTGNADNDENSEKKGIKAYAEELIQLIRGNGSDGIIIVGPRMAANGVSMSPAVYDNNAGDDPIYDPLSDDLRYNIAYTHHAYPYANAYASDTPKQSFGWRLRDAYDAGLTIIVTETSPMDSTLDRKDPISYDMDQMAMYHRMFQEYDISFFYFKYVSSNSTSSYNEWNFFRPGVVPNSGWTEDDLTECGKWYIDLLNPNAMFVRDVNYSKANKETIRDKFEDIFTAYGLFEGTGEHFTAYPGFAQDGIKVDDNTYFFWVGADDTLNDIQYKTYCQIIWQKAYDRSGSVTDASGKTVNKADVPATKNESMTLVYTYDGQPCKVEVSCEMYEGKYGVLISADFVGA